MSSSAIVIGPSPVAGEKLKQGSLGAADYMPLSIRMHVAGELNRLWEEFVNEMHDGPLSGPQVAEKFWKYVLAGG